jgi:dipeptidase
LCDTLAIVISKTGGKGGVLFAKSSDRAPNEPQILEWHSARDHAPGEWVQCTHIRVPQARRTHAVLLSRPAWMWGAEIGTNEHGVTIGNEAVFTREKPKKIGLTGMDMLRLALERSKSADEAVDVLADLVETHDQGGRCGFESATFSYHSSFLVADAERAWVFETAGRRWAKERVTGARAISNGLTIPGFAEEHADPIRGWVAACAVRRRRTETLAEGARGAAGLARILRDHGPGLTWPRYAWLNGGMRATCMHAGGVVASAQTTASWVTVPSPDGPKHFATATSSPCLSLFKPIAVREPVTRPDPQSLFWAHEKLHRRVMRAPERLGHVFLGDRNDLEKETLAGMTSAEAFALHEKRVQDWCALTSVEDARDERPRWVRRYWKRQDRILRDPAR